MPEKNISYRFIIGKKEQGRKQPKIRSEDVSRIESFAQENCIGNKCTTTHPTQASNLNEEDKYAQMRRGKNIFLGVSADNFNLYGFFIDIAQSPFHIVEMGPSGPAVYDARGEYGNFVRRGGLKNVSKTRTR